MTFYFTFHEGPSSSIYQTQVLDVLGSLSEEFDSEITLLSFLPVRGFFRNRRLLKQRSRVNTIVLPHLPFPALRFWKLNACLLFPLLLFHRSGKIICRGLFSTSIALTVKKLLPGLKVVFDSRGVVTEEEREYQVYPRHIGGKIAGMESNCLHRSDFCMFITVEMVRYFRKYFGYDSDRYVIIPCTLGDKYESLVLDMQERARVRERLGYTESDIVLVYSGSNARWQSFELMISYLSEMLSVNPMIKCLLLTQIDEVLGAFMDKFPGRVKCSWVEPKRVAEHLVAADYAILFREPSITNSVSSPTKFAEYLSCGLPVLANNTMAITDLVRNHELGWIVESGGDDLVQKLASVDIQTKNRIRQVALQFFWKKSPVIRAAYQRVLEC